MRRDTGADDPPQPRALGTQGGPQPRAQQPIYRESSMLAASASHLQRQPTRDDPPPREHASAYLGGGGGGRGGGGSGSAGGAADADEGGEGDDDASQEAARKEWLQYHLQVGEWDKAEELIVTAQEREDLEYLMEKERRERRELQGRAEPARAATGRQSERVGPRSVGPQSAMAHQAAARRNPPPPEPKLIDDNDDMM